MTKKYRSSGLLVSRLTRSVIYRPMAAVLAVLLMPTFSWLESTAGVPVSATAKSFQSSAQTVSGCGTPRGNAIIQEVCVNGVPYGPDLDQLEADGIKEYFAQHDLGPVDPLAIYFLGRTDLRSAIRAEMLAILQGIINKPANARSDHEKRLYAWFETLVQQNEIAEYTRALAEYRSFQHDPCSFKLDPDIANQYGLSYNGPALCLQGSTIAVGAPWVPAASYFTAVGIKYSYGKSAQDHPNFAKLVAQTQINLGAMYGTSFHLGAAAATVVGVAVVLAFKHFFPYAARAIAAGVKGTISAGAAAAGAAAIVFVCVVVGVIAAFQLFNNQKELDQINNLHNLLSRAQNSPPDLLAFASDTNALGSFKLTSTLVSQTVPDIPGTFALPAHRPTDPVFVITQGANPTTSDSFTYDDWSGVAWRAETVRGWFKQTCLGDSSGKNCPQPDSFIADIEYVDGSGVKRTASRFGPNFVITKAEPAESDKECPADEQTGVTPPGTDFSQCVSYVASEFEYTYQGNAYSMRLSRPPVFTSDTIIHFTWQGPQQHAAVTAAGIPAPDISLASGSSLPAGVTFSRGNGTAQFNFAGASSGTRGTYHVTLQAHNADGTITQSFFIVIVSQLAITSADFINVDYGQPTAFLVTTTGELPMKLSISPQLLFPGLSFHDNGNGTATISGSTTAGSDIISHSACFDVNGIRKCTGITASNAQGSVRQETTIFIKAAPHPQLTLPAATFVAGTRNSVQVTTTGATTPVIFHFNREALSWLNFRDKGDGTGVLSGTPPAGTAGSFAVYLYPEGRGERCCPLLNPQFTVNVLGQPVFLTPNVAQFSVGDAGSFTIRTNQPSGSISEIGTLPQGLEFTDDGNGTATISGTPAVGAGGSQTLQFSVKGDAVMGTQELALQVNEAPAFKTAAYANFYAGQENSFPVVVSGYPALSNAPASLSKSAGFIEGMEFTVSGLPAVLTYSNLNPEGYSTGTLTLSGTPSSSDVGQHVITISASNGVGAPATQTFTLRIAAVVGDVNGDGVVNCTDLNLIKASLNTYRGEVGYNPAADINNDGVINVEDLALAARNVPAGTVCQ
ncbi:MAG: hypothetical protein JO033_17270 [Acidobacteriaceae bacterium]|nr:hypothetical protein [Acidobacteriaceae bacterium]MBV9500207.1 hypothetical protein [Acidobacteriaceae bacterium]